MRHAIDQIAVLRPVLALLAAMPLAALVIWPSVGLAQTMPPGLDLSPESVIRGQGWAQALNVREMGEFLLALVEVTVMTAAIVFHPVNWTAVRSRDDFHVVRQKFLFGLIGMTVGFLVMHHGYLIGFVIFGLGGLMRFRTEPDENTDTTRLIVVSLVGLCVGLDLPVMALIITASTWLVIYLLADRARCYLTVRFDEKRFAPGDIEALAQALTAQGLTPTAMTRNRFKASADYVLRADSCDRQVVEKVMAKFRDAKDSPVKDWHLE